MKNKRKGKEGILDAQETLYDISWAFSSSPLSFPHRPSLSCLWPSLSKQVVVFGKRELYLKRRVSNIKKKRKGKKKNILDAQETLYDIYWAFLLLCVLSLRPLPSCLWPSSSKGSRCWKTSALFLKKQLVIKEMKTKKDIQKKRLTREVAVVVVSPKPCLSLSIVAIIHCGCCPLQSLLLLLVVVLANQELALKWARLGWGLRVNSVT